MRVISAAFAVLAMAWASPIGLLGQSAQPSASVSIPRLVSVTGVYQPADGQPPPAGTVVTLLIYADEQGGTPLWQETQNVVLDKSGRYSLLLGAAQADGIPLEVFASGDARWLALHFAGLGEVEGARTRITSVPYALKSADADTLGGHPASAYVLAPTGAAAHGHSAKATSTAADSAQAGSAQTNAGTNAVQAGTTNVIAKYVSGTDVGNSALFESGGQVGINTTAPADALHVRFTNTGGTMTGLALQNMGNTANSYSGTLFYDQNGQLGQFQGFNNLTHEYRINNIAKNGVVTDGSINFMVGGSSRFFASALGVGIGTTAPSPNANLDVSNAVTGTGTTIVNLTTYSPNGFGPGLNGKKARGTQAAPTSVLNNDGLLDLNANGYGATGFANVNSALISMRASENWTDTAQGSYMNFATTANGTTGSINRMTINSNGRVGIGVFGAQAPLEVSNFNGTSGAGMIYTTTFTNAGTSLFIGRRARGTGIAPTAVLSGDGLAGFEGTGYGATGFSFSRGGMDVAAAENWTDTAQGTRLIFNTTSVGTTTGGARMTVDPSGNVGIGTLFPQAPLEVSRTGTNAGVVSTLYANNADAGSFLVAETARGTAAAPQAVQAGDFLGAVLFNGYDTTGFGEAAVVGAVAAENFTNTARGTAVGLGTTPLGGNDSVIGLALLPSGNVSIGTPADANGIPTATDKLQVFGDLRVGTTGTNGCLKNFAGTGIAGTCSSDRRLKRDITPFASALNQLTALQPVHFYWRAAEFPDRHFGETQAYGLIAQDVERIFPELVVTGEDGFKAIDYSKLPLLTIQAVKELKTENDDLKRRLADIEHLVADLLAGTARR
jgi:hypothetical protein